jgi:hypothetical protein
MRGTRWIWLAAGVVVAIVLVGAALASRGGDDDPGERSACILDKQAHARYVVVSDAYERGELGSETAVRRSIHPEARAALLEPDGDLRAWESMSPAARQEFVQWATSGVVYDTTEDAQVRATDAIDRSDCE